MCGRGLLVSVLILAGTVAPCAEPGEMTAEERARLEAERPKLFQEMAALFHQGKVPEALRAAEQFLALNQKLYPPGMFPDGHTDLVASLNNIGGLLWKLGRMEEA